MVTILTDKVPNPPQITNGINRRISHNRICYNNLPEFILKISVNGVAASLPDQMHQTAQLFSDLLDIPHSGILPQRLAASLLHSRQNLQDCRHLPAGLERV